MKPNPLPPYGRQLQIPQLRFLFLFVGEPNCWNHARTQKTRGYHNHLCLPDPERSWDYRWPVEGCSVIVIIFCAIGPDEESGLVSALCFYRAVEIVLRHWPSTDLIVHRLTS